MKSLSPINENGYLITPIILKFTKKANGVFHFAALWLLHCWDYPSSAFKVNIEGTFNVLEACVHNNVKKLISLPDAIKQSLKIENKVQVMAKEFLNANGSMFLGRGLSFPVALEGALKLKELSYLHAEGYPAGEMKHGPLALIEDGLPVIVIAPKDKYFEKTLSNMQEVIARGGKILFLTDHKNELINENIRFGIRVPSVGNMLSPILLTIPIQLLAYHVALLKNCDIDKPRNLAKSVTVE